MVKLKLQRRAAQRGLLKCPMCAPRRVFCVDLRGGECISVTDSSGDIGVRVFDNLRYRDPAVLRNGIKEAPWNR
jgi:hypothetical protein